MSERVKLTARIPVAKKKNLLAEVQKTDFSQSMNSPVDHILFLHRAIGNQAVQRLFKSGIIQAKIKIGQPGDIYEQEADRVTEQVMCMPESHSSNGKGEKANGSCDQNQIMPVSESSCPECKDNEEELVQPKPIAKQITPLVQRQAEPKEEEEEEPIKAKLLSLEPSIVQRQVEPEEEEEEEELVKPKAETSQSPDVTPNLESYVQSLKDSGHRLPNSIRSYFEPRFGSDFSQVKVHADAQAAESAWAIGARAYTIGRDVVFGAGQYAPETYRGRRLLAHELTHVIQQRGGRGHSLMQGSTHDSLQLSPSPETSVWGGFRIYGDRAFIERVREDLNRLNATTQGNALLQAITENRRPWYRRLIRIESLGACGFINEAIRYNATGCNVANRCQGSSSEWTSVPNYVYLFHEAVHAYLYYIANKGTHPDRECMATGLGRYFTEIPYNENRLRCELGLPVRPCYDETCTRFPPPTCGRAKKTIQRIEKKVIQTKILTDRIAPLVERQVEQEGGRTIQTMGISGCIPEIASDMGAHLHAIRDRNIRQQVGQEQRFAHRRNEESHSQEPLIQRQITGVPGSLMACRWPSFNLSALQPSVIQISPDRTRSRDRAVRSHIPVVKIDVQSSRASIDQRRYDVDSLTHHFYAIPPRLLPPGETIPAGPILTLGRYGCGIRRYGLTIPTFTLSYQLEDSDFSSEVRPWIDIHGISTVQCWIHRMRFKARLQQEIYIPSDLRSHPCASGWMESDFREVLMHEHQHEVDNNRILDDLMRELRTELNWTIGIGLGPLVRITSNPDAFVEEFRSTMRDRIEQIRNRYDDMFLERSLEAAATLDPHDRDLHQRTLRLEMEARRRERGEISE